MTYYHRKVLHSWKYRHWRQNIKSNNSGTAKNIILGDFNTHISRKVEQIFLDCRISILNTESPTHSSGSAIDLSIASASAAINCFWEACPSVFGSNKYPIIVSFEPPATEVIVQMNNYNFKKAQWEAEKKKDTESIQGKHVRKGWSVGSLCITNFIMFLRNIYQHSYTLVFTWRRRGVRSIRGFGTRRDEYRRSESGRHLTIKLDESE